MSNPPQSALQPVSFTDVTIDDGFWSPRLDTLRNVTIEYVHEQLEQTGRIDNFRVAAGAKEGSYRGRFFNDSDVYKWLEAACYLLTREPDPELQEKVDTVVDAIADAQQENGYLNTYFQLEAPDHKWTNLNKLHELYCAGHLFEAAVAHYRATDAEKLLTVACDFADHIDVIFGPDARTGAPGHEEIELALVKLYRVTEQDRYLQLAEFFLKQRGREESRLKWEAEHPDEIYGEAMDYLYDEDGDYDGTYFQDHAPVREQDTVEGHAVRATYLYTAMTEVAMETGDEDLHAAAERLWENMVSKRMYVTGGIGSSHYGERFTADYHLPNEAAYAETCAALGNLLWNRRLHQSTGASKYAHLIERTLYNGLLAGVSRSGDRFFYVNPLAARPDPDEIENVNTARLENQRQEWFGTACCPTNVPRLLAVLSEYIYSRANEESALYVDLYIGSHASTTIAGVPLDLEQETEYPWDGHVEFTITPDAPVTFNLYLRVPEQAELAAVTVNGEECSIAVDGGYVVVNREWHPDDEVTLSFDLPITKVEAHPNVRSDAGKVALQRGPLVYCLEEVDNPRLPHQLRLPADGELTATVDSEWLDGVVVIEGDALAPRLQTWNGHLYQNYDVTGWEDVDFRAVPYHLWAHRQPGAMEVWLQTELE